ncbi:MAG: NAD(P)/FAD-dependent oxidoreductase [Syntrophales bacterium]|jgi:2,4-dienoyl-CoA reductase-like NADH-dependent reductase (Old Yellow Enzyme family)/thioredoxin reductase|nr:NAD(P)/FAD-dependent oxidoreductase [Syntrophales bacterium]MDD4338381.1 FAD-dependent oxidoreductase [Syntrophales bacterium]HOG06809.1 FAD-dependent oxidoreductase [Syntrophales bacterium]HOS77156.1 FAD-dependent oxidoreductase [Syntrophales bacterium]HPB70191.1 FAD-dependent oxidoreductase [Syntrophales bacterium]
MLEHLFSPVTINGMTLKNRAVMPPMGTGYGNADGTASERLMHYLAARARGGAGLIITEICAPDPRGKGFPNELGAWSDDLIPSLGKISAAVHREGAKVALQLHHAGRETFAAAAGGLPEAPSAIPSAILGQPCEAMSLARIAELVAAFARAAARAKEAGFDTVELHGAHGYLLNQFLSPFSNQREDAYGGSEENRSRFVLETLQAVRAAVGPAFPVLIRISGDELIRGGYDLDFTRRLAPQLVAAGADAIHVSVGVYSTPGNLSIASMDTATGFNLFRARAIREAAGVPVIGVGRIQRPADADRAIAAGDADLISFGRQHLADPDFISKTLAGREEDIRWCVACNQGCIERLSFEMRSTTCTFNPECGQEYRGAAAAVTGAPRLWVIGAGPAGLAAALASRERGFAVEIFEKATVPGGQLQPASRPPHKQPFMDWVHWAVRQLEKRGVRLHYNEEMRAEILRRDRPDAVILASGASPVVAKIPGIDGPKVCDARDVLMGKIAPAAPAVVLGAGYVGMETADYLVARGIDVVLLEMQPAHPVGKLTAHAYWLHRRIREGRGRIVLGATVTRVEKDAVFYRQGDEERRVPAALVVTAMGARPDNALEGPLVQLGISYRVVGDAVTPRRLLEAIHEGHQAGRDIQG